MWTCTYLLLSLSGSLITFFNLLLRAKAIFWHLLFYPVELLIKPLQRNKKVGNNSDWLQNMGGINKSLNGWKHLSWFGLTQLFLFVEACLVMCFRYLMKMNQWLSWYWAVLTQGQELFSFSCSLARRGWECTRSLMGSWPGLLTSMTKGIFCTIWRMLSIKSWEERKKGVTCGVVKFLFLRNYHMGWALLP